MDGLLFNNDLLDQYILAGNENTKAEQLRVLADHFCDKIRMRVAENPATPIDVLRNLSHDANHDVRIAVATNRNCESVVLERLARDADVTVRHGMAQDIGIPPPLLEKLAEDENCWVKSEAEKTLFILKSRGGDELAKRRRLHVLKQLDANSKQTAGRRESKAAT
jgi:hypothetical protein